MTEVGPSWRALGATDLRRKYPVQMEGDRRARLIALGIVAAMAGLCAFALIRFDMSIGRLWSGLSQLGTFLALMFPPDAGGQLGLFLSALGETLAIAFLGTLTAAALAFPLGLLAAKNVLPVFLARFFVRRSLDTLRAIDTLIWALVWINVVGLGPFAGVLAIATTDVGALGKLFSEAIENTDRQPVEGVTAAGGAASERIRFGLLPQALPVIFSQILYYFEANTRSATIIGIVGAGGIGLHLAENIRILAWDRVAMLIILVLVTVAVIDYISSRLRRALMGRAPD